MGLKWQPARVLQFSVDFAATHMAAPSYLGRKCKHAVQPDISSCQFLYAPAAKARVYSTAYVNGVFIYVPITA